MVQYRYALNSGDKLVIADELRGQTNEEELRCISCNRPVIAKVNGKIHRPHFAHKTQGECNEETYLHRLGKRVFEETYKKCLAEKRPFVISIPTPSQCTRFRGVSTCFSDLEGCIREYDLTSYYSEIGVECADGAFVPDIILRSSSRPSDRVYIEIAVTHFLSEAKKHSGIKTIEIPIESEEDVERLRCERITGANAVFIGFAPLPASITHDQCRCARKLVSCFYVYESGKAFLEQAPLAEIQIKLDRLKKTLRYRRVFLVREPQGWGIGGREIGVFERQRGKLFIEQVKATAREGVPIKNCYLCRYHGNNGKGDLTKSIYCKTFRKACNSNEASECDRYRTEDLQIS